MDLYKDILLQFLRTAENLKITFDDANAKSPNEVVESICYKTIQEIRNILDDDLLGDFECIERIVALLEEIGSSAGSRHKFD